MLQIKIISYPDVTDVEKTFNTWKNKIECTIKDIKYSTVVNNGEVIHSMLITYVPYNRE